MQEPIFKLKRSMTLDTAAIDNLAFARAMERVTMGEKLSEGFTVYRESYVHKAVKLYLEPDEGRHEVKLQGSVADIFDGDVVTEVQTGGFYPLLPKLRKLTRSYPVHLVHPYPIITHHRWRNPESGEISTPRKGGSRRSLYSVGRDVYSLRELIPSENLRISILAYECDEYRMLDGYGKDKKRRATLIGKIPTRLVGVISFAAREDYLAFIPDGLSTRFTRSDYLAAIKSRSRYDAMNLKLLLSLGLIREAGKEGRVQLYEQILPDNVDL